MTTDNPTPQVPAPQEYEDDGDLHMSVMDVLWVLALVSAGVMEDATRVTSGEMLFRKALGLPMNQTVRLPDGSFVTVVLLAADEDDLNRTHG